VPTVKIDHGHLDEQVERSRSLEHMQRESGKSSVLRNQEKTIAESRSQEAPEGKLEIWEYVMEKGWLLVIWCVFRFLFLVLLSSFLCYQAIAIVVIGSDAISYCNGFLGNNCACTVAIDSVVGIGTWSVMYKL
jgi:hypothetical protein